MKRIIALVLALVMVFALAACGTPAATESPTPDVDTNTPEVNTPDTPDEPEVELPAYKVGVILYDLSNQWAKNIMNALETLGKDMNITFEYAVGGTDPEATIAAIQNFGAADFDGILTPHPGVVLATLMGICEEYGMYLAIANDPASGSPDYATVSENPYFAGEVWEDEFETAYGIVEDMISKGAETFALHGFPSGLAYQFDQRAAGARAAIEDNGKTIVAEGLSFNKAEAAENIISQFPDVDAFFSSVETVSTAYQTIVNAGRSDVLLTTYDPADGTFEAMEDGTIDYAIDSISADVSLALVLLYNAMSGNRMVQSDGSAVSIKLNYVIATTAEEYQQYATHANEDVPYYFSEIKEHLTVFNPDANYKDFATFATQFSLSDILARHG